MLQALLNVDLTTALVCVTTGPGLVGETPLELEDGALFPLGSRGARCLLIALSGLILQVVWPRWEIGFQCNLFFNNHFSTTGTLSPEDILDLSISR